MQSSSLTQAGKQPYYSMKPQISSNSPRLPVPSGCQATIEFPNGIRPLQRAAGFQPRAKDAQSAGLLQPVLGRGTWAAS